MNFDDAVTRLNSRNLPFLLRMCSYLSSIETFSGSDSPVFPLWNFEKQRLLTEAVLASRAAHYKTGRFTLNDFRFVINAAGEALYDPRIEEELKSGGERQEMLFKMQRFFARTANIQLRHQEHRIFMGAGRLVAMFEVLPLKATSSFPDRHRKDARDFPQLVKETLGASIFELFLVHWKCWQRYAVLQRLTFEHLEKNPPSRKGGIEPTRLRQAQTLFHLASFFTDFEEHTAFTADNLRNTCPETVRDEVIEAFLNLFSRTVRQLREQAQASAYQFGPTGWQLSPLERYPVVRIDGEEGRYCIPNVRTFMRSFADIIHFSLQSELGQRYNVLRGVAQEVYLQMLVRERLSPRLVLPERSYKKRLGAYAGPDLTIVEDSPPKLIAVESKGKRLLAETRFTLTEEAFDKNYAVVYDALEKLKIKMKDLYSGIAPYRDVQSILDKAREKPPFVVVVVGESTYLMTELLRYRAENEAGHPLSGYPFRYCVVSPQTFDLAVEHAAREGKPLHQLLEEFWQDCGDLEADGHMAENFRGRDLDEWETFAAGHLKPLLAEFGVRFQDA